MLVASVMTLLVPVSANLNYWVLTVCRFINGVAHVILSPIKNNLINIG